MGSAAQGRKEAYHDPTTKKRTASTNNKEEVLPQPTTKRRTVIQLAAQMQRKLLINRCTGLDQKECTDALLINRCKGSPQMHWTRKNRETRRSCARRAIPFSFHNLVEDK